MIFSSLITFSPVCLYNVYGFVVIFHSQRLHIRNMHIIKNKKE